MVDESLLQAGRQVLREHGWQHTTAERIAKAAGISRVTLHRRGVKREDVLAALAEAAAASYREALWPALVANGTGAERLALGLDALCAVAEEHLEVLVALRSMSDAVFHAEGDGAVDTRPEFTEPIQRLLRDGAADGSLRADDDPAATATVLFNAVGWTYLHLRTGHRWTPERARAGATGLPLRGLRP